MSIDTRTPAEIAYDATSLYLRPTADADTLTPDEAIVLDLVLARQRRADENVVATWIDAQRPAMLDWETARQRALVEWKGTVETHDPGRTLRYPILEEVEIARASDGTPIYGEFDNDDLPLVVSLDWRGFTMYAGADGFDLTDQNGGKDYHHTTLAQWESLKALITSGVIDQALSYAKAWDAEREEDEDTDSIIKVLELMDGGE